MASPRFEIAGTVHAIPPPRNDTYASFVLMVEDGKYAQYIPFEHKRDQITGVNVGDEMKVTFNARGREWKNPTTGEVKWFGTFFAFKVDVTKRGELYPPPPEPNGGGFGEGPDSDIPF